MSSTTEVNLQIGFRVFGVLSTIATLAGLHHRDSLGCILIRRSIGPRMAGYPNEDEEFANDVPLHLDISIDAKIACERRPTLPPSYEQSNEDSETGSVDDDFLEYDASKSRRK